MITLTKAEYEGIHPDYRCVWTTERYDWPDWDEIREQYIGKRALMQDGALHIEGLHLTIID